MSRILIVDDDEIYGQLTLERLTLDGHEAVFQRGPFGATTALKNGDFDAVILDVRMPGLSGPSLVEIIKKQETRPRLILNSNIAKAELEALATELGVEGWFPKSSTTEELWALVRRVCS